MKIIKKGKDFRLLVGNQRLSKPASFFMFQRISPFSRSWRPWQWFLQTWRFLQIAKWRGAGKKRETSPFSCWWEDSNKKLSDPHVQIGLLLVANNFLGMICPIKTSHRFFHWRQSSPFQQRRPKHHTRLLYSADGQCCGCVFSQNQQEMQLQVEMVMAMWLGHGIEPTISFM